MACAHHHFPVPAHAPPQANLNGFFSGYREGFQNLWVGVSTQPLDSAFPVPVGTGGALGPFNASAGLPCTGRWGKVTLDITRLINCSDFNTPVDLYVYVFAVVHAQVGQQAVRGAGAAPPRPTASSLV